MSTIDFLSILPESEVFVPFTNADVFEMLSLLSEKSSKAFAPVILQSSTGQIKDALLTETVPFDFRFLKSVLISASAKTTPPAFIWDK